MQRYLGSIAPCDDNAQMSQPPGMHIWWLSQARINWEACDRKGIQRKIGGMMEVGALMFRMGWRLVECCSLACVIFPRPHKIQNVERLPQHILGVSG